MAEQLHKRFTDDQVKLLFDLYLRGAINFQQALQQLGCTKGRFYQLLAEYRESPEEFRIAYHRNKSNRRLSQEVEQAMRAQSEIDRQLIGDKKVPLWQYNYASLGYELKRLGYKVSDQCKFQAKIAPLPSPL